MADDGGLTIRFSADISSLLDGARKAQVAVQNSTAAMRSGASDAAQLSTATTQLTAAQNEASAAATKVASTAHGAGAGVAFYAREVHALADEALSGRLRQAQGTAANLLLTLAQARPDLAGAAVAFAALAGTVAYFAIQAKEANDALKAVKLALTLGDATGLADADLKGLIRTIQQLPGSSYETAKEVVSAFAGMQDASAPLIKGLTASVGDFALITGQKIPEAKKALVDLFNEPLDAGNKLRTMFPAITSAEIEAYAAAKNTGSAFQAQAAMMQILAQRLEAGRQILRSETAEKVKNQVASENATITVMGFAESLNSESAAVDEATKKLRENIQATKDSVEALRTRSGPTDLTMKTGIVAGEKQGSPTEGFDKQQVAIRQMSDALDQLRAKAKTDSTDELETSIGRLALQLENAKNKAEGLKATIQGGTDRALQEAASKVAANLGNQPQQDELRTNIQSDKDTLASAQLTADQRVAITTEMSARIKQLRDLDVADAKAKSELQAAQAAKGSQDEYAARAAAIRTGMAVQAQGTAAYTQSETALTNLARQQEDQRLELARYSQEKQTELALQGVSQRMQGVRAQAQEGIISGREELSQLMALQRQKEELERVDLESKLTSYKNDATRYQEALIDKANLTKKFAAEEAALIAANAKQTADAYKQAFEKIGSTVSSTLVQMIEGQARAIDLVRNIARQLVASFIEARIKVVADNLAGVAQRVAATATGQSAETAATAAGAAARTGIDASAAAAGSAVKDVAASKSIASSAAETYAGVYGFFSPVLGPAAAAPATAASAAVSAMRALVGFETGAWSTPATQLALIHQGEMVVPAGATPWAQSLMSNAAQGGGQGGGDTHIHYAPNVSAIDGRGLGKVLMNHASEVLKAIDHGISQGSHLKMKNRIT